MVNDINGNFNIVAHRGQSNIAPENTTHSLELAKENNYNYSEIDVHWTKDNVPVLLHDDSIDRTTSSSIFAGLFFKTNCNELTYEELLDYDFGAWKSDEYKDTKIATFDEALEIIEDSDMGLYVEIKEKNFDVEKATQLVDKIKEMQLEDKITWISFNKGDLKLISDLLPEARLGLLTKNKITDKTIDTLNELKTDENEVFLDAKTSKINSESDELLDNAGFSYETWCVDDLSTLKKLIDYGCSGITTNSLTQEDLNEAYNIFAD